MQIFYANWHKVAPDGNAHSQSESLGTMTQYLYRRNLKKPLVVPIRSGSDLEGESAKPYFGRLDATDRGYLECPGDRRHT
jgi:hypothetical protein